MMAALTPVLIHILARVGDSEVLNEIGTVEADVQWRAVARVVDTHAATEATGVVMDLDVVKMLRQAADEIEAATWRRE